MEKSNDVLFETRNNAGIITLNRPKSLNALNSSIITQMLLKLWEWEKDKCLVIIKGAGRAFCSGGDIKQVLENRDNVDINKNLILYEYNMNNLIGNYKIPYVALMDGIAMGGGLGVSVHGSYRIATENTVIAMPETKIGIIPDVGATYFLPRLPFRVGFYLGLTSDILKGSDVVSVGIATHYVPSYRLTELEYALSNCITDEDVKRTIKKFEDPVGNTFSLSPHLKDLEYCFSGPTIEKIIERLKTVNTEWSMNTMKTMRQMCPLSLKLSFEALKRGAENENLWRCVRMENRITVRLITGYNFKEGVRALLKDKDNNPQWIPKTLEEISDSDVESYFYPLPPKQELRYIRAKSNL